MTPTGCPKSPECEEPQIIKRARNARGWSQTDLAERAGVSRPSVARIEGGDDVSTATLDKVAEALGLTLELQ